MIKKRSKAEKSKRASLGTDEGGAATGRVEAKIIMPKKASHPASKVRKKLLPNRMSKSTSKEAKDSGSISKKKSAAIRVTTPKGGHRWVVSWEGARISTSSSGSSVSAISEITAKFAPALKRLAKK